MELAGGGSVAVAVGIAVAVAMFFLNFFYRCYYPHTSRDLVVSHMRDCLSYKGSWCFKRLSGYHYLASVARCGVR